jgi:hypothetical protein
VRGLVVTIFHVPPPCGTNLRLIAIRRPYWAYFFAAARYAAQRFFVAAAIAALPAALSFRFGFGAAGASGATSPLAAAHPFLCPAAIFLRAAALILRRRRPVGVIVAASAGAPESIARNSAI